MARATAAWVAGVGACRRRTRWTGRGRRGSGAARTGLLSTVHLAACAVVHLAVGVLTRAVLSPRPSAARVVTRISGVMMIAIGAFLLVERLPG
jgi:threonine/homoserine/homoserine lactone efflux protein